MARWCASWRIWRSSRWGARRATRWSPAEMPSISALGEVAGHRGDEGGAGEGGEVGRGGGEVQPDGRRRRQRQPGHGRHGRHRDGGCRSGVSTVDPDARHTRKSGEARRDDYRAHVAADPETGILTDEKLTWAAGQENSDPAVAEEFLAAEAGTGDAAASGGTDSADDGSAQAGRASQMTAGGRAAISAGTAT